jgi:glycosyltransferase involved in cell wall biosynthesis
MKLPAEAFVIGYAGALTRDKGFDQLLEAMDRLKSVKHLHLLVAGEVVSQSKWRKVVNEDELRRVHFLGQIDHQNMPAFMASLDLYVIPSFTETLPTTLLEALAAGTPVMATGVGGVTEFLQSQWGIVLATPEAEYITQALDEWQTRRLELEQMGKLGQQYVRIHHNWERTSELTEGVYQACLKNQ